MQDHVASSRCADLSRERSDSETLSVGRRFQRGDTVRQIQARGGGGWPCLPAEAAPAPPGRLLLLRSRQTQPGDAERFELRARAAARSFPQVVSSNPRPARPGVSCYRKGRQRHREAESRERGVEGPGSRLPGSRLRLLTVALDGESGPFWVASPRLFTARASDPAPPLSAWLSERPGDER